MTEYTAEEQAEHRALWVAALRSGEYGQGQGYLAQRREGGGTYYCCLGVACEVARANGVDLEVRSTGGSVFYGEVGTRYLDELYLPDSVRRWLGLVSARGALAGDLQPSSSRTFGYLSSLNDIAGYDFNQIADVIESGKVAVR